jgi:ABC-type Mn2+/Zn2+ transport system ATPase subunit
MAPAMPPLVEVVGANAGYGRVAVLRDITLAIAADEFLAVVGANGAGKTTLLRLLAGVLRPLSGHVRRARPLRVGYVPQERTLDAIFPLTARDVVRQGRLPVAGRSAGATAHDSAVDAALDRTSVRGLADAPFGGLSGGQKQRVLVARALATEPALVILDEPTHGMDPPAERALMDLLRDLHADERLAVVLATHDLSLAGNYATRLALVDRSRDLFSVGHVADLLTDARLSGLYASPMRVREVDGWRTVLVGGAAC